MSESRPGWLDELYDTFGEPKLHFEDKESTYFNDSEDRGRPVLKTGWTWFPNIEDSPVNHSLSISKGKGFTVVYASTHLRWKPPVQIVFSEGYGPDDRDIELILDLSQFSRRRPRFISHETRDLREPGATGK